MSPIIRRIEEIRRYARDRGVVLDHDSPRPEDWIVGAAALLDLDPVLLLAPDIPIDVVEEVSREQ